MATPAPPAAAVMVRLEGAFAALRLTNVELLLGTTCSSALMDKVGWCAEPAAAQPFPSLSRDRFAAGDRILAVEVAG